MKKFTFEYRGLHGEYCYKTFSATCNTDARFIARSFVREIYLKSGYCPALFDFNGNYIEL